MLRLTYMIFNIYLICIHIILFYDFDMQTDYSIELIFKLLESYKVK